MLVVYRCNELPLSQVLRLIDKEGHDCLGDHVVHALADCIKVAHNQRLNYVHLQLGPGRALARILVLRSHVGGDVWQVDRLDILLDVLLDLVVRKILKSPIIELLRLLWCLQNKTLTSICLPSLRLSLLDCVKLTVEALVLLLFSLDQLIVAVYVEDINDRVGTAHKIRMIGVDVGILHLNKRANHPSATRKLLSQQLKHDFNDLAS